MRGLRPWTMWLAHISTRDALPMWLRRRAIRLNFWLLNRGWA